MKQVLPDEAFDLVIEPGKGFGHYWTELLHFRELFCFLTWRDLLVRYKQTSIGVAWVILRPFFTMLVFTLVFGRLAGLPSEGGAPYALMVFAALLPWQLFSSAVSDASNSLIGNVNLISKVYFPRLIIPASAVVTCLVDFFVAALLLLPLMAWYGYWPTWRVMFLPLFVIPVMLAALGLGMWMTALNVKYRDFRYIVPFALQLMLFLSPVGFSSSIIPEQWRLLYALNPLVGIIDAFRWALLGGESQLSLSSLGLSLAVVAALLLLGFNYFRNTEKSFADVI